MKEKFREFVPHIIVVLAFILISVVYFYPELDGQSLAQMDNIHAEGMAHEINQYESQSGEYSAWTNSMFGGMPAYQIKSPENFNIHLMLQRFLHLFLPYSTMAVFFAYLLGFYVLLISLDFKKGIAVIGALAFALSSYNIIIIAAGHITKCYAIAYMAPVLAGTIYCFNRKYIPGFFILAFSLGIEIACNHTQILYYLAIMCGLYVIYKFVLYYRTKQDNPEWLKNFGKASAFAAIAIVFAVLPNITNLWTTYEYSKYSTRSQSELTSKSSVSTGLDKDYALAWSYGKVESFNLLIPDLKGGASAQIGRDENALKSIKDQNIAQVVSDQSRYWGDQPFTSGPVYIGAVIIFLFVLGLFIVKNPVKWWLLAATIASLVMAWGKNFGVITDFLFDYFPMYNKFRSPSMALVIAQVAIPFLAMITLKVISDKPEIIEKERKSLLWATGITAGICLLFILIPSLAGSFLSSAESEGIASMIRENPQMSSQYSALSDGLVDARQSIMKSDAWRSFLFIFIAAGFLFISQAVKMSNTARLIVLGILIGFDLWTVDVRYLSANDYKSVSNINNNIFKPSVADEFILKDTDPDFRVLNLSANVFNDGITPYFHKSIGGYHGAKMRRYQEFIDTLLAPTIQYSRMLAQQQPEKLSDFITSSSAINMLNTKFIIVNPAQLPIINIHSYGNAWFVNKFNLVETADQEIGALRKDDLRQTAIINKNQYSDFVKTLPSDQIYAADSSVISLVDYKPNYIKYNALAYRDRLAVFSEIYYPKGWTAYIDGKEVSHVCADYILRALVVPQGQHTIEFRFAPTSVKVGSFIAAIASLILLLTLGLYWYKIYSYKFKEKKQIEK